MSSDAGALVEAVRETIRTRGMLSPDDRVLVAVSGGPDSICLLHVLHELSFSVVAAHLHHGTRGADSDADAALVRSHAERLGVPCREERCDAAREAHEAGRNFHEYARERRYAFLAQAAAEHGCAAVATGHHADDQAETVLMRILRGTGPRGLAGIPPVGEAQGVRLVRPLIGCSRTTILDYLQARGLEWREDASNRQPKYLRNRVRQELIPYLEREYNPHVQEALARLADTERVEDDYLTRHAEAFLADCVKGRFLDRAAFARGHRALQRRAVLALAQRQDAECPFERVDQAVDFILQAPAGKAFHAGGFRLRNDRDTTDICPEEFSPEEGELTVDSLPVPGEAWVFYYRFRTRILPEAPDDLRTYCGPTRQVFDADAVGNNLGVRHWRPGDRFTPLGMDGTRKLQDYFTDLGLPRRERLGQLLLVAGERIVWVVGRAVEAAFAVTARTQRILEVEVIDEIE